MGNNVVKGKNGKNITYSLISVSESYSDSYSDYHTDSDSETIDMILDEVERILDSEIARLKNMKIMKNSLRNRKYKKMVGGKGIQDAETSEQKNK